MTSALVFLAGAVWLAGIVAIVIAAGRARDAQRRADQAVQGLKTASETMLASAEVVHDLQRLNATILQNAISGVGRSQGAPQESAPSTPAQIIQLRKPEEPPNADA